MNKQVNARLGKSPAKPASLWQLLWGGYKRTLCQVIGANLLSAGVGVMLIAHINRVFLAGDGLQQEPWQALPTFLLLVLALMLTTFLAQYALTCLGHRFVFELKSRLVKELLGSEPDRIWTIGFARLIASLSQDIQSITMAFVRLPELIGGVIVCLGALIYLASLSQVLVLVVLGWVGMTVWLSGVLVGRVYHHLEELRVLGDDTHKDYEKFVYGHKDLALHKALGEHYYHQFLDISQRFRQTVIKADSYHLSAVNFSNIMIFALVGLLFVVSSYAGVDKATTTTFGLCVLFLQGPLLKAVGAYPVWQSAGIALQKIQALHLSCHQPITTPLPNDWHTLSFVNMHYRYPSGFGVCFDLCLKKGEVVFLVGENGAGKSTLAKLLTGLMTANQGQVLLDGQVIEPATQRQLFSAIFSDSWVFDTALTHDGQTPNPKLMDTWIKQLKLDEKIKDARPPLNTQLSTGQKKRLALLLAIACDKPILLLDEWAADQDPSYRKFFYDTIIPILKDMGKTLFVISHDDRYFDQACRLFCMQNGKLVPLTNQITVSQA